jgi:alanine dehydrogenase
LKVKEPMASEIAKMRSGQVLFTYLHLAASRELTEGLLASGATAIAYETVELADGSLPLLAPMSEIAGRLSTQAGAHALLKPSGGRGILIGGATGVKPGTVVVLGAGVAGRNAAAIAVGMQAEVIVIDSNADRLKELDDLYPGRVETLVSSSESINGAVLSADLVIGAVLIPGAKAPRLVTHEQVLKMKPGSVLVDISIDQGGCFEDSHPTTHADPTYVVGRSLFYCVANMPGAVPNTSTYALTNVTMPYVKQLAAKGWQEAIKSDGALAKGLNCHKGLLTSTPVAATFGMSASTIEMALAA